MRRNKEVRAAFLRDNSTQLNRSEFDLLHPDVYKLDLWFFCYSCLTICHLSLLRCASIKIEYELVVTLLI